MGAVIDRGPTQIEPHILRINRDKVLALAGLCILQPDGRHGASRKVTPRGLAIFRFVWKREKATRGQMSADNNAAGNDADAFHGETGITPPRYGPDKSLICKSGKWTVANTKIFNTSVA